MITPTLIICSHLDAGRHLTLPEKAPPSPRGVHRRRLGRAAERVVEHPGTKLRLTFDDVLVTKGSRRAPDENDIHRLIVFAKNIYSPAATTVLVHCGEGQSRSPAAYVFLCVWMGPGTEEKVAGMVRGPRVGCVPNRRMIEIGDDLLGRGGKMLRALGY